MKKYLGINLTKEIKDVYSENYKTLIKGIEDDLKKQKDIPCSMLFLVYMKHYYWKEVGRKQD